MKEIIDKKVIIFDLDGTLAESKQAIDPQMMSLLCKLSKKIFVVVISGADFKEFQWQLLDAASPEMECGFSNIALLSTSGSRAFEYGSKEKKWNLIYEDKFAEDKKREVMAALREIIKSDEYDIPKKHYGEYIDDRGTQITFSALGQSAPLPEKLKWDPDHQKRKKIKQALERKIKDADISIGGTTSIDILPKGRNKGAGIRHFLEIKKIPPDEAIFVGDALFPGGNDWSVKEAGIEAISVKNPAESAKYIKNWLNL